MSSDSLIVKRVVVSPYTVDLKTVDYMATLGEETADRIILEN